MLKQSILIIDDEKSIRDTLILLLSENFNVEAVSSGKDGLEKLAQKDYDLVFLDLHIKDLDGFFILNKIKKDNPQHKVIIFSGTSDEETVKKSFACGADDFLPKPFALEDFEERVRRVLP